MTRARIVIQHTLEYDINPEHYPEGNSELECLMNDIENYSRVDVAVEAILTGRASIAVTGELVREGV